MIHLPTRPAPNWIPAKTITNMGAAGIVFGDAWTFYTIIVVCNWKGLA